MRSKAIETMKLAMLQIESTICAAGAGNLDSRRKVKLQDLSGLEIEA